LRLDVAFSIGKVSAKWIVKMKDQFDTTVTENSFAWGGLDRPLVF
jgi:hypothetical protein